MIEFTQHECELLMIYTPERDGGAWLQQQFAEKSEATISGRIFTVTQDMIFENRGDDDDPLLLDPESFVFSVGTLAGSYYCIESKFLGIEYELVIHQSIPLKRKTFAAERNISIFRRLNEFGLTQLIIGGDEESAMPKEVFEQMLKEFPNTHELNRYAQARVSGIIRNYVPIEIDFEAKYRKYMDKKESRRGTQPLQVFSEYESDKYTTLIEKIEEMLKQAESYTENQWQDEIIQIIQLLYPKYIKAFKEGPVRDSLAGKNRKIDFLMVDASGYVDAIELKKPFANCIVTSNHYRGNHVPMSELNGTVMQLEKYLYHLNRWGQQGEDKLNKRYADQLPEGLTLKIVNPSGMIIMGRDEKLSPDQKTDFEVIRRKYRHVLEIMTYDDMLRRLKVIRDQLKQPQG
tara:strand:+ start:1555 stop:2763 length:1209 start_codon:yes stop_codon:yes gene_type:complete